VREDLEQQEQLEAIKGFWKDNRRLILALLAAFLVSAAVAWGWKSWKSSQSAEAGLLYEALDQALSDQKIDAAEAAHKKLQEGFASTAYADLAALRLAKAQVAAGQLEKAQEVLQAVSGSADESLRWVARVRLAAVLIDLDRLDEALKAVSEQPPEAYAGLVDDRRGDVLVLMGRTEEARQAWTRAREALQKEEGARALILLDRKLGALEALSAAKP